MPIKNITPDQTSFDVLIHDEKGIIFNDVAASLSSVNDQGPFDILAEHTNFITLIKEKIILHLASGEKKEFAVDGGVLHCFQYRVEVYLGVKTTKPS